MTKRRKGEIEQRLLKIRNCQPPPIHTRAEVAVARVCLVAIALILLALALCHCAPVQVQREYVIKIDSEIPVSVSVYKSCEGNWNFCQWD